MSTETQRIQKLKKNTISSIILQITTVVCGFIIPRMILGAFGSNMNGLVNSISQFLSVITFLEFGVGTVVQSTLYKPLASNDKVEISKIMVSAQKFFNILALILLIYILVLMGVYPFFVVDKFDYLYTAAMLFVLSFGLVIQYYYGITNRLLLTADQCGYISNNIFTVTIIINAIACWLLITCGASLLLVKFISSLIFVVRPIALMMYVKRHYDIDYHVKYESEPIKQKWNGVAQHIAAVVMESTDLIVLTIFSTLANVSIYSIYNIVILGVKQLFLSTVTGIQSLLGELIAKQEKEKLKNYFSWIEWSIHTGSTYVFSLTLILIVPFIEVYTKGITDANYIQPSFAFFMILAHAFHCFRLPYNIMILAAGHFKQTQMCYIYAALLNIVISIVCVNKLGLVGVAIGTLVALAYQIIWMVLYNAKYLITRPLTHFVKQIFVDCLSISLALMLSRYFSLQSTTYFSWFILAIQQALVFGVIVFALNCVFYKNKILKFLSFIKSKR